jgi:hypothetical protein
MKTVKVSDGNDGFNEYLAAIYRYEYNGNTFLSDNYSYAGGLAGVQSYVYMDGKSIGDKMPVYVCTWWPSKSTVTTNWEWWYLWGVFIPWLLWFFLGGPWFILAHILKLRGSKYIIGKDVSSNFNQII